MNIDIRNIKNITVVNPNSLFPVPDKIQEIQKERKDRMNLYPNLKSMGIRDR